MGKIIVGHIVRLLVPSEDVVQPGWQAGENPLLRPRPPVATLRNRADPATPGSGLSTNSSSNILTLSLIEKPVH